jgi:hypothetical protein
MNEQKLLQLKEEIDNSKQELSQLQGKLSNYTELLEKEIQCKSVEDAEKILLKYEKEQGQLQEKLSELKTKIEDEYLQE